jgi:hypothetical protein
VHSASEDSDSESSNENLGVADDTSHASTRPTRDCWEPQSREQQKFKANGPEASHQLTQQEVNKKHSIQANQAMQFWGDREFMKKHEASRSSSNKHKRQRCDAEFTQQMHLDFAAVTDSNRAIQVKTKSMKSNDLVSVLASSYQLPKDMKLAVLVKSAVRLGTDNRSTVLQECGLLRTWVEEQFLLAVLGNATQNIFCFV